MFQNIETIDAVPRRGNNAARAEQASNAPGGGGSGRIPCDSLLLLKSKSK